MLKRSYFTFVYKFAANSTLSGFTHAINLIFCDIVLCTLITSLVTNPCVYEDWVWLWLMEVTFRGSVDLLAVQSSWTSRASLLPTRICISLILPFNIIPVTGGTFVVKVTACLLAGLLALLGDRPNSDRAGSASYVVTTKSA